MQKRTSVFTVHQISVGTVWVHTWFETYPYFNVPNGLKRNSGIKLSKSSALYLPYNLGMLYRGDIFPSTMYSSHHSLVYGRKSCIKHKTHNHKWIWHKPNETKSMLSIYNRNILSVFEKAPGYFDIFQLLTVNTTIEQM